MNPFILKTVTKHISTYSHKLILLNNIPHLFCTQKTRSGIQYLNQIYSQHGWSEQYKNAVNSIANKYIMKNQHRLAIKIRKQYADRLIQQKGQNSYEYIRNLYDDSVRWESIGMTYLAEQNFFKILKLLEKYPQLRNKLEQNRYLEYIIGKIYYKNTEYKTAKQFYEHFANKSKDFDNNKAIKNQFKFNYYYQLAQINSKLNLPKQSLNCYRKLHEKIHQNIKQQSTLKNNKVKKQYFNILLQLANLQNTNGDKSKVKPILKQSLMMVDKKHLKYEQIKNIIDNLETTKQNQVSIINHIKLLYSQNSLKSKIIKQY